ncbi:MAG: SLBB domain-containing protein [Balneolaceae bacterium]
MQYLKNTFLLLILLAFSFPSVAQDVGIDFKNFKADNLSDEQILQLYERMQDRGMTVSEVEALAIARGTPRAEVSKLRSRLNEVRSSRPGSGDTTTDGSSRMRTGSQTEYSSERTNQQRGLKADTLDVLLRRQEDTGSVVFGADIFSNENLSFEPSLNIATPRNYTLGPGDQLILDIWGAAENTYQLRVSPEGAIQISNVGPVFVSGLTIEEATQRLTDKLSNIYSGLKGTNPNTFMQVTLRNIRSIKVSIIGKVSSPGTYTLSSLSTVFNALYAAGGPNKEGSYRSVKVLRNGKVHQEVDLYDFLVTGDLSGNISLKDQDIIKVDSYLNRITVEGEAKRVGLFETKEGETFADLLDYTGGFNQHAFKKRVKVERNTPTEKSILDIRYPEEENSILQSGDIVTIGKVLNRYENKIEIEGAVFRPGEYQLEDNPTLYSLIQNAEGVMGDAFMDRAMIYRTRSNYTIEAISVNLASLLENPDENDVSLVKDDLIKISSIFNLRELRTVTINGSVISPGTFPYKENSTLKDIVLEAEGFKEEAAPYKIEVARRIQDDRSGQVKNQIAELITVDLDKGLSYSPELEELVLQPFDQIFVRKSPAYETQQTVRVEGEVLYPGTYVLSTRNFRLSDLIEKSGGVTEYAYVEGASLDRNFGRTIKELELNLADSVTGVEIESLSQVGIQLKNALNRPGSDSDLLLQEGDIIKIPKQLETVQVRGEVLYPVNTRFRDNKSFRSYIASAGGFTEDANTKSAYIVYANGEVDRTKRFLFFRSYPDVRPGSVLIIPPKKEKQRLSTAERITVMSTIVSLAAIVTNTIFQIRRN